MMAREMRDSGIAWADSIPVEYKISRVGLHYDIILGKMLCSVPPNNSYTLEPYFCAADIHFEGIADGERKQMWFSPAEKELYLVQEDDLLVVEGGAGAGGCAVVSRYDVPSCTYIQNSIMIVRSRHGANVKYLRYLIECFVKQGYIDVVCNKATIPHFTKDKLATVPFFVFSQAEQKEVADYLDQKCAETDAVITKTKATIEEYKKLKQAIITAAVTKGVRGSRPMKDSGIEWIPSIPADWNVRRGKYLFRETNERSETGTEELLTVSHITGITPRSQKNVTMFMSESLVGYKICHVGDIAANTMWMWQGAIGVSNYEGVISPSYNTYCQSIGAYEPRYLDYLLRIRPLIDCYSLHSTGITASRLRLYPEQFLSLRFVVPPLREQQEIVDYLDQKCADIDVIIEKKTALLEEIESYKKSFIYEYVTGKKEVASAEEMAIAVTYPYFPSALSTHRLRFAQAVLLSKILDSNVKRMGRVKAEKILFTIEYHLGFDFNTEYHREAAGPLDGSIYECEKIISRINRWFYISNSQYGVSYNPQKDMGKYKKYYHDYFSDYDEEIERIISIFKDYSLDQAEVVATLYGAWNDLIIDKKPFTDDDIVDQVLFHWNDSKKRFPKDMWLRAIEQMRQNNLIPKGYGKHTIVKEAAKC